MEDPLQSEEILSEGDNTAIALTTEVEPPPKKFKHLSSLLAEKRRKQESPCTDQTEEQVELERYSTCTSTFSKSIDDDDPFNFWMGNSPLYLKLSRISLDLFTTPASTAPVERIFFNWWRINNRKVQQAN